jgi:hypothetical protein
VDAEPMVFRSLPNSRLLNVLLRGAAVLIVGAAGAGSVAAQTASTPVGRIAGTVLDVTSGRPLSVAIVTIEGTDVRMLTDVQGRFRTPELSAGSHTIVVEQLGYATLQQEGVLVAPGAVVTVNLALTPAAIALDAIVVETVGVRSASTTAGLLAQRRAATAISDGVSAEQIRRAPDSDAGDAVRRVTGVSLVDDKFVIVRGLGERYSNTLLNGAEVASPEPAKRIVPLNVFPASLIESVVTSKTATADKPGDFAGGLVEIRTKDFPEERVLELDVGTSFSSLSTFRELPIFTPSGKDHLGLDGKGRFPGDPEPTERFAESLRNEWTPRPRTIPPDMKVEFNYGDQLGSFERAVGFIFSGLYSTGVAWNPESFFGFAQIDDYALRQTSTQATREVELGGNANIAFRLGSFHTVTWKNIATRSVEELSARRFAFRAETAEAATFTDNLTGYQVRYIERVFRQSQLGGSHLFGAVGNSRVEWAVTASHAGRDEPENRSLNYLIRLDGQGEQVFPGAAKNFFQWRYLDDDVYTAKLDYQLPLALIGAESATVQLGGYYRSKQRDFRATIYEMQRGSRIAGDDPVLFLPPEQFFSPENLDPDRISFFVGGTGGIPYQARDDLAAGYGMVDFRLGSVRMVAGARAEQWALEVEDAAGVRSRSPLDVLGSVNLSWSFHRDMNFRLAAYQTVARPDPRELTQSPYQSVSGECTERGNPDLVHTRIVSSDARLEWYPGAGELVSASAFYKKFDEPIVQLANIQSLGCEFFPINADFADNLGVEVEVRKSLAFVSPMLESWTVGGNFTWVTGAVTTKRGQDFDVPGELNLQDQSEYLANGSLGYANAERGLDFTVLYNLFTDRIRRYGMLISVGDGNITGRTPDVVELGRGVLDFKLRKALGSSWSVSISGSNLTGVDQEVIQALPDGETMRVGYTNLPVSFGLSLKYSF